MIEKRQFYIDGAWVDARDGRDHAVIDPATEEPCATIALGGQADTDAAVAAAKKALPGWMATPAAERIALVEKLLEAYKARRAKEMAQAMSLEMGAPIALARANQVGRVPSTCRTSSTRRRPSTSRRRSPTPSPTPA